jgi:peptidase M28-like protein
MKRTRIALFLLLTMLAGGLVLPANAAENGPANEAWTKTWERDGVAATIRHHLDVVDGRRMKKNLFYLSKSPLPFRKLNLTLPGHEKSTLHEANDYLAGKFESWGYQVERESVKVQAFRCDVTKPKHAWYSAPKPEDPWYTGYNVYAERKGQTKPEEIVLVLAHKDSQSWIDSPGANDNAIGTVGVLELARVLARYNNERTIRFLLCNEEHTPWTSVTSAKKAKARGDNIIALFNLDGIGVKSPEERAAGKQTCITAYTEQPGDRLGALVGAVSDRFEIGLEHRTVKLERPSNDDGSFIKEGYKSAILVIGSWPYGDPNYHLETDVPELTDVDNAAKAVQAVLAAVLTLDLH